MMLYLFFLFICLNCVLIMTLCNPLRDGVEKNYSDHDVQIIVGTKVDSTEEMTIPIVPVNPSMFFTLSEPKWRASAYLISESGDAALKGAVLFSQHSPNHLVRVTVNISGLPPGSHAIHIHTFGDISRGCRSTGPHMPNNFVGNVEANDGGEVAMSFYSSFLSMFGYRGIVGRSVLIHSNPIDKSHHPDVFSSPANEFANSDEENILGPPLMCGVITVTNNREK